MEILLFIASVVVLVVALVRIRSMTEDLRRFQMDFEAIHDRMARLERAMNQGATRSEEIEEIVSLPEGPYPAAAIEEPAEEAYFVTDSVLSPDAREASIVDLPESGLPSEADAPDPSPDFVQRSVAALKEWFQGEQGVVRIGILLLFVGVALLVKYAADHSHFGPKLRLAGSIAFGMALLGTGWRLRDTRRSYALALQGGGIGVLYIASFAASRLLGILEPAAALPVLGVLSLSLWALAVFQESVPLAALGVVGGFAAPILLSDGSGGYLGLLSYYLVLDLCILGIISLRPWRVLGWMGFVFTLGIGATLGIMRYQTTDYLGAQLLLGAFFLVFSSMGWILARRTGRLDGALVFGTAIAATTLQGVLVKDFPHGMAISAAVLGTALALAAAATWRRMGQEMVNLAVAWIALGVSLSSLSIPLFFDPQVAGVLWAMEGAGLLWLGLRQNSRLSFAGGLLLQGLAGALFVRYLMESPDGFPFGTLVCGTVLLLSASISSLLVERLGSAKRFPVAIGLAGWGLFWALVAGLHVFACESSGAPAMATAFSILMLALAALGSLVAAKKGWQAFQELSPVLFWLPLAPAAVVFTDFTPSVVQPLVAAALAAGWIWLDRARCAAGPVDSWTTSVSRQLPVHATWLVVLSGFVVARTETSDAGLRGAILAGTWILWSIPLLWGRERVLAPFRAAPDAWRERGFLLVLAPLWTVDLLLFLDPSDLFPGGWIPLAGPTDLVGLAVPVVTAFWAVRGGPRWALPASVALAVAFAHVEILRAFHHWGGVEWSPGELWNCAGLQASLGLLWGASALVLMRTGHIRSNLRWWRGGAVVLGLTVAKLLFVDLSGAGTVGRIVAFLGVGLLMLLVGWVAPLPRKARGAGE